MAHEKLYLILGCFGHQEDDFVNCLGVENRILWIAEHLSGYPKMMDYLDQCRLFEKPTFDFNAIRHILFNLKDRFEQIHKPLWKEKKFTNLERFTIEHRKCGIYLKLSLESEEKEVINLPSSPEIPIIAAHAGEPPANKIAKLRVIRGR